MNSAYAEVTGKKKSQRGWDHSAPKPSTQSFSQNEIYKLNFSPSALFVMKTSV